MADQPGVPRVLILDDGTEDLLVRRAQVAPMITAASMEDITINLLAGGYNSSEKLRALARQAKPDEYDFVIIGNNLGLGLKLGKMLDAGLRPKTLIVWNDPPDDVDTRGYAELGFVHFGTRMKAGAWYNHQVEALRAT